MIDLDRSPVFSNFPHLHSQPPHKHPGSGDGSSSRFSTHARRNMSPYVRPTKSSYPRGLTQHAAYFPHKNKKYKTKPSLNSLATPPPPPVSTDGRDFPIGEHTKVTTNIACMCMHLYLITHFMHDQDASSFCCCCYHARSLHA